MSATKSYEELINITAQPVERCKFKRGEIVRFVGSGILRPVTAKVVEHYDFKHAVRIEDSNGERIVTADELVGDAEYDKIRAEFIAARAKGILDEKAKGLEEVVALWNDGYTTAREMSGVTGKKAICFVSKIAAAKRIGLIAK